MDWGCQRSGCHSLPASYPLSLAAFWASQGCQGVVPAGIPSGLGPSLRQLPAPLQSACLSPHWLPGGAGGPRSGGGWGHSCSSPGFHFLPELGPLGQRKRRQEGRSCHQAERPTKPLAQPSCTPSLSILAASSDHVASCPVLTKPGQRPPPPPSRLPPYLAPDRRWHTLYPSGSPGRRLTTMLLAAA